MLEVVIFLTCCLLYVRPTHFYLSCTCAAHAQLYGLYRANFELSVQYSAQLAVIIVVRYSEHRRPRPRAVVSDNVILVFGAYDHGLLELHDGKNIQLWSAAVRYLAHRGRTG